MQQPMTYDMTRLRKEISAGHRARQKLRKHLAESRRQLRRNVADTLAQLRLANADMFNLARGARTAFAQGMAMQVDELRMAFRADRLAARRAWHNLA